MLPFLLAAVTLDPSAAARFAELALACVDREYPNKIAHVLNSDADVRAPRKLTPAFFGCFDWHSSVHGHWLLARLARTFPQAPFAAKARDVLERHITAEKIAVEVQYVATSGRATFERPYGLAWLLQLAQELREWDDAGARRWSKALTPLEQAAIRSLSTWLPKLSHPERTGVHSQTAFALGLMHDASVANPEFRKLVDGRIRDFYLNDRNCPVGYEPSGQDFLSPCIAEADAVRRVLSRSDFAQWLDRFLPEIPLNPEKVTDPTDGQLAHLDGLNLSRAWMLEGIASALPARHRRCVEIEKLAKAHRDAGLAAVTGEHYEGGHWLGSFAVYLVTGRGLEQDSFERLRAIFEYDRSQAPVTSLSLHSKREGVNVYDFSFNSPVEGRVPGLLVVPAGKGPFPVILYGHWMMQGSPLRNKGEFLEEAIVMAQSGAMSVLLDSPLVRKDSPEEKDPMEGQGAHAQVQMVKEWRRALDVVLARSDADPGRLAYVGHSFHAGVGAKLAGIEKRIGSFVLMANQYSLREFIYDEQNPIATAERKKRGDAWVDAYFQKFPWDDSRPFVERSAPAAVFLQYGRSDKPLPPSAARLSFARFGEPKKMEFYDAGHELNAAARLDRAEWLAGRLKLGPVDVELLNKIAPLK